jgi:hypothetical protein
MSELITDLGHNDHMALPGVDSARWQARLQSLVHLHWRPKSHRARARPTELKENSCDAVARDVNAPIIYSASDLASIGVLGRLNYVRRRQPRRHETT